MKIFLQDSTFAHCLFSNNPLPPIQFSEDIIWDKSQNFTNDDLVIYTDKFLASTRNNNKKDIAWLIEPEELLPHIYQHIRQNHNKFFKIFTHDEGLLHLPNAILIPYGGCWIKKEDFSIHPKTKNISIVCSNKKYLTGHKLRHEFINHFKDFIDVYGNGYNPIDNKLFSLKDYRYQIVIENTKKDFWFTEKLIDCFVTGTIPIYYGCDKINKFFDKNGMIIINSLEDFYKIKNELNESFYLNKIESIKINFNKAKNYTLAENSISKFFKDQLQHSL
jgi:hypothetical protein